MAESHTTDGPARILVVDDEPSTIAPLVNALSCCGYDVETSTGGEEALRILDRRPPILLIADLVMPQMPGDELMAEAVARVSDLAVILLSTPGQTGRAVESLKRGAYDFVTKPFELIEVVTRVRLALERKRTLSEIRDLRHRLDVSEEQRSEAKVFDLTQDSLSAFIAALESKDEFTHNHSARVAELSTLLARTIAPGDEAFQTSIRFGAFLHDIGKIGVRESVLNKPGSLTDKEYAEVQRHPVVGEAILRPLVANPEVLAVVRSHHERWDGRGYPDRLAGTDIALGARIVAVADSYDAMISARPYRLGMTHDRAIDILQEGRGTQWDSSIVDTFLALSAAKQLPGRRSYREHSLPGSNTLSPENVLRNAG